jgi:hypothetical protein
MPENTGFHSVLTLWYAGMYGLHPLRDEQFRVLFRLADVHLLEMRGETTETLIFTGILPVPGHSEVYAKLRKDDLADDEPSDRNEHEDPPFHKVASLCSHKMQAQAAA